VRTDTLCRLSARGQAALVAHGVRTIVDVRSPSEIARDPVPHPYAAGAPGAPTYRNISIDTGLTPAQQRELSLTFGRLSASRTELNKLGIDTSPVGIATIARTVANAEAGGVVVHCHAGKDRTGVLVAVVLSAVGVPDEVIAQDYALTARALPELTREWLDGITRDPDRRAMLMKQAEPTVESMLDTLAHLRERHGGPEAYLRSGGLSSADAEALRERLVE
jgi:protein tyrosine/serine phosphatase